MPQGRILVLSGAPGVGKSVAAQILCRRLPRTVHVPVDDLRELVVSGYASPLEAWTDETTRQFRAAREAAARLAADHADAGFDVVIDDVVREADVPDLRAALGDRPVAKVLLSPSLAVAAERNRERTNKAFDPAILSAHTVRLHASLLEGCRSEDGWVVIDTSAMDPDAVADALLDALGASGTRRHQAV